MKKTLKGFTLVEVLIVIIIVGILIAALLPRLIGVQSTARDTARASDTRNVATSAQLYIAENNAFPDTGCLTGGHVLVDDGYMSSMPEDPQGSSGPKISTCNAGEYYAATGTIGGSTVYAVFADVENASNGNTSTLSGNLGNEASTGTYYRSTVQ